MSGLRASRREVLAGAMFALTGSVLPSIGLARQHGAQLADGASMVVLHDVRLALPEEVRQNLGAQGARILAVEADPVRMWRGEHAGLLGKRSTRLLGVTNWPGFLMVRGLAEESGRRLRYQRLDASSGAMVWLIA